MLVPGRLVSTALGPAPDGDGCDGCFGDSRGPNVRPVSRGAVLRNRREPPARRENGRSKQIVCHGGSRDRWQAEADRGRRRARVEGRRLSSCDGLTLRRLHPSRARVDGGHGRRREALRRREGDGRSPGPRCRHVTELPRQILSDSAARAVVAAARIIDTQEARSQHFFRAPGRREPRWRPRSRCARRGHGEAGQRLAVSQRTTTSSMAPPGGCGCSPRTSLSDVSIACASRRTALDRQSIATLLMPRGSSQTRKPS